MFSPSISRPSRNFPRHQYTNIFDMIKRGRLHAIKKAFASQNAYINMVEEHEGRTLLHSALPTRHVEITVYLVYLGASAMDFDHAMFTPADYFWRSVLSNSFLEADALYLARHFKDISFIGNGKFTLAHKIIFGLCELDLNQVLHELPDLINQKDAYGATPLHWAARRGDTESVSVLLSQGARVDEVERNGYTPLMWGMDAADSHVTGLLLAAGADANHTTSARLERSIHVACHAEASHCHISELLKYGADAAAGTRLWGSPLEIAADRDFAVTVDALFAATPIRKHATAVMAAVKGNCLRSLRKLLELGADCWGRDESGKTVLHHAAIHGDDDTLWQLFLYRHRLPSPTVDDQGMYPIQYARNRSGTEISTSLVENLFEIVEEEVEKEECDFDAWFDCNDEWDDAGSEENFQDAVQEIVGLS